MREFKWSSGALGHKIPEIKADIIHHKLVISHCNWSLLALSKAQQRAKHKIDLFV